MSDVNQPEADYNPFAPNMEPVLSKIWDEVYGEEDETDPAAGGEETPAAGAGAETPAAPVEGAGAEAVEPEPQEPGAVQPGPDPAAAAAEGTQPSVAEPAEAGTAPIQGVDIDLGDANIKIASTIQESFKAQTQQEVMREVSTDLINALQTAPRLLVGEKVPSLKNKGEVEIIRDSQDAREWQETARGLLDAEVNSRLASRMQDAMPILSTLQDSILLFQSNPDLNPSKNTFDKELADRVMEIAKSYEHRVGGKLFGFHVNLQPIINSTREQLAKERGTQQGLSQAQRQQQAASQTRNEQGQFTNPEAPQAGIPSKAGATGEST